MLAALAYSVTLATACLVSYELTTHALHGAYSVSRSDDLVGGLWAVIATAFVYRWGYEQDLAAARSRIRATSLSFVLCLGYLLFLPFHPWGMATVIGAGTLLLILARHGDDVITGAITTAVVMVAAALDPHDAWRQPILRFADTVIGVIVGLGAGYVALRVARRRHRVT
jgi:uncharacterized membrane protein YccC